MTISLELAIQEAPFDRPPPMPESRAFGDGWLTERRSVVLSVPSLVSRHDRNLLINPEHPEFARIRAPAPVVWDPRLFRDTP